MINEAYKYSDITAKVIGCAMKVHQKMRNGYQEVGKRRVDFLIENKVVVEIKAVTELTDAYLAQALNYLEALNLEIGLLINFGSKSLEIKRIINNKHTPSFKSN